LSGEDPVVLAVKDDKGREGTVTKYVHVSAAGNKDADLADVPRPDSGSYTDVTVDIRISSYAQAPETLITAPDCPNASYSDLQGQVVRDNDLPPGDPEGVDGWGVRKNRLHITFRINGSVAATPGPGRVTVCARWQ
jgi:hypothetical protein